MTQFLSPRHFAVAVAHLLFSAVLLATVSDAKCQDNYGYLPVFSGSNTYDSTLPFPNGFPGTDTLTGTIDFTFPSPDYLIRMTVDTPAANFLVTGYVLPPLVVANEGLILPAGESVTFWQPLTLTINPSAVTPAFTPSYSADGYAAVTFTAGPTAGTVSFITGDIADYSPAGFTETLPLLPDGSLFIATPEPSTLALLATSLAGLGVVYLRRRRA